MFVTSGVISAKRKYIESVENQRGFVPQPRLRLMILLMSLYQMKSFNQLIKINEFFLAFRAVVLDICLGVSNRDPDPTTLTTPTLRPYTHDPTTLPTTLPP